MKSTTKVQRDSVSETLDQCETESGRCSISVMVSAIVVASLVMALAIVMTAHTLQI